MLTSALSATLTAMHELSIAVNIVEMAEAEARRRDVQVSAVHLRLGALSGIVKDALLFSYDLVCEGTALCGSSLVIEEVPTVIYCSTCKAERALDSIQLFCCPVCGAPASEVVRGKELEVVALEVRE